MPVYIMRACVYICARTEFMQMTCVYFHEIYTTVHAVLMMVHCVNAAVVQKMRQDPYIWQRRPISKTLLQYAAEDVTQLLLLADKLSYDLGAAALKLLPQLSMAYSQWYWDASDRDGAKPDSYRLMVLDVMHALLSASLYLAVAVEWLQSCCQVVSLFSTR